MHWYHPKEATCQKRKKVIRQFLRNQAFNWKVDDGRRTTDGQTDESALEKLRCLSAGGAKKGTGTGSTRLWLEGGGLFHPFHYRALTGVYMAHVAEPPHYFQQLWWCNHSGRSRGGGGGWGVRTNPPKATNPLYFSKSPHKLSHINTGIYFYIGFRIRTLPEFELPPPPPPPHPTTLDPPLYRLKRLTSVWKVAGSNQRRGNHLWLCTCLHICWESFLGGGGGGVYHNLRSKIWPLKNPRSDPWKSNGKMCCCGYSKQHPQHHTTTHLVKMCCCGYLKQHPQHPQHHTTTHLVKMCCCGYSKQHPQHHTTTHLVKMCCMVLWVLWVLFQVPTTTHFN